MEIQLKTNLFEQAIYQNVLFILIILIIQNFLFLPKSANNASQPVTDKNTPPKIKFYFI